MSEYDSLVQSQYLHTLCFMLHTSYFILDSQSYCGFDFEHISSAISKENVQEYRTLNMIMDFVVIYVLLSFTNQTASVVYLAL